MNYEGAWIDLKTHLKALAESIDRSIGNMETRPYIGAETDELFKAYREAVIVYSQKDKLRIVNNIVALMEWMEQYR